MLCGISGEAPQEPVVSKKSGRVYEKRLIEEYINAHATEPQTGETLTSDDLLVITTARTVRPRPPEFTSIPSLLATFQMEWDNMVLETYNLKEQLARTREELAGALYQQDAAVRVIARLTRERDEARQALGSVSVGGVSSGDAMVVDSAEALPEELTEVVNATQASLSKSRKKRPTPAGWVTGEEISSFEVTASNASPIAQTTSLDNNGDYAAIGGLTGEAAIYSVANDAVERQLSVSEPVIDTLWTNNRVVFATKAGSVKVFENGEQTASFTEHAGAATGVCVHPSGDILASVGVDKSMVFYDLKNSKKVARGYADAPLTTCAFHPDGHLFAVGSTNGSITLYMTSTLAPAATFSLGTPIQSLSFSENGYWFAAAAKSSSSVTIFDLRKEGDAATAKVIETGGNVESVAWDYTGQFLATVGDSGVTVQQYVKKDKSWAEPLKVGAGKGVRVRWGGEGKRLITVNGEGVVSVLGVKA